MSKIEMPPSFSDFGGAALRVCLATEAVDCQPADGRFDYTYALPTKPGGSSAAFTGSVVTPDVAGKYVATVTTAGGDSRTIVIWAFASATAYVGLATAPNGAPRDDATRRGILLGLARARTDAELNLINAGTWPAGLNLATYGG